MKFFIIKSLFLLCTLLCLKSYSQVYKNDFGILDSMTMQEVKMLLVKQFHGLEKIEKFKEPPFRIELAQPGKFKKDDFFRYTDSTVIYPEDSIVDFYKNYFNTLSFKQNIHYPASYISTDFSNYEVEKKIKNYRYYSLLDPVFTAIKVYYKNKKVQDLNQNFDTLHEYTHSWYDKVLKISNSKYIDSLTLKIQYQYPANTIKVRLDSAKNVEQLLNGEIKLLSIQGGTVKLLMSNSIYKNLITVEGFNKNKAIRSNGNSMYTMYTEESIQKLQKLITAYKKIIEDIENNSYATIPDVRKTLEKISLNNKIGKIENLYIVTYFFNDNIERTSIIIKDNIKTDSIQITLPNANNNDYLNNYIIAKQGASGKKGFINNDGQWVVQPEFEGLRTSYNKYFYYGEVGNDLNVLYRLDTKNNKLIRCNYKIDKYINDTLINIEKYTNGPEGIITINETTILPMKYDYINFIEDYFLTTSHNIEGLYDMQGKNILPEQYKDIKIVENGFLVHNIDNSKDFLSKSGNNITKGKWKIVGQRGPQNNLLLVERCEEKVSKESNFTSSFNCKYYYLDTTGNIAIDASKYESVDEFSSVLAKVEKDNKIGYINTKGNLVVPLIYSKGYDFFKNYALVTKEVDGKEIVGYINKNNEWIKTLPDQWIGIRRYTNKLVIELRNGDFYDEEGNLLNDNQLKEIYYSREY